MSWVTPRASSRRSPAPGAAVHRPRRHVRVRSRSDPQALKDDDREEPAHARGRHASLVSSARSSATRRRSRRPARARPASCARAADHERRARGRHAGRCAAASLADERPEDRDDRALRARRAHPARHAALRGADRDGRDAQPAAALPRAVRHGLQLLGLFWTLSPSTSPSATRPASRSARCSTWPRQDDGVTAQGAAEPAPARRLAVPGQDPQNLHGQPYGAAINEDGAADCENGQRGYSAQLNRSGTRRPTTTSIDSTRPAAQGPTFKSFKIARSAHQALGPARRAEGRDVHARAADRPLLSRGTRDEAQPRQALDQLPGRPAAARRGRDHHLPRVHEGGAVPPPLPDQGGLPQLEQHRAELACADRRGEHRQGRLRRALHAGKPATVVTMRIEKKGLPIHKRRAAHDPPAHLPRGQLLRRHQAGQPVGGGLNDGDTIPINQTRSPVQLDQMLTSLQRDTRNDLQMVLDEYSTALGTARAARATTARSPSGSPPTRTPRSSTRRRSGSLEGDLAGYIKNAGATAQALDRNRTQLKSLIADFNTTAGAFARPVGQPRGRGRRAAAHARGRYAGARRAQRGVPAARAPRRRPAPGGPLDRPDDRREPAARRAAPRAGLTARAARPRRRPAPDRPGARRQLDTQHRAALQAGARSRRAARTR